MAMTPPTLPVVLVADGELQENPISIDVKMHIPKLAHAAPPQGDTGAVAEAAQMLVAAETPVILADRMARTPAGLAHLIALAEALQAPVVDLGGRMNFPPRPRPNKAARNRALVADAELIWVLRSPIFMARSTPTGIKSN